MPLPFRREDLRIGAKCCLSRALMTVVEITASNLQKRPCSALDDEPTR